MDKYSTAFVNTFAQVSGANVSLLTLLKHMDRQRFDPVVYLPPGDSRPVYDDLRAQGIPVELVRMERPSWRVISWANLRFFFRLLTSAWHLRKLFRLRGIDLVVLNGIWNLQGALAAFSLRLPIVWWIREDHFPRWVIHILARIIERLATERVCISSSLKERFYGRRESKSLSVIYNGVDCDAQSLPTTLPDIGIDAQERVIGCVGPIYPPKGQLYLVRALARLLTRTERVVLLLIGGELESQIPYAHQVQQEIQNLGLEKQVHFLGFRRDIPALLEYLNIYVQPSISEGFGRTVVEAMWAECPVVASSVGGLREVVVDQQTGILVPPADSDALAEALLRLLEDEPTRQRMGRAGKQRVREVFDIRAIAPQAEQVLLRAVEGHPAAQRKKKA